MPRIRPFEYRAIASVRIWHVDVAAALPWNTVCMRIKAENKPFGRAEIVGKPMFQSEQIVVVDYKISNGKQKRPVIKTEILFDSERIGAIRYVDNDLVWKRGMKVVAIL